MIQAAKSKKTVLICINTAWNFLNFRSGLIRALVDAGYEVVAVAPPDAYVERVTALGCRFVPLPMDNQGTHPGRDALLFWRFLRLLRQERPDVYLGYTVKPNVYGSLAAHHLGIPVINNIAGLGVVFGKTGLLVSVVRGLYRLALGKSATVFFQNDDDRQMFIEGGLVKPSVAALLPGSGVDLSKFSVAPMPQRGGAGGKFRFLLVARMLWEKGIAEFAEAAKQVRARFPETEFCLLGFLDVQNPRAISRGQMDALESSGMTYLGVSDDVRAQMAEADCIVLPSYYREGTPRTLLEAAALGRPIITTNAVGCREVVDDGINGYLCEPRSADDLARKMCKMVALSYETRSKMALKGREKMEQEFDEKVVIEKYLNAIRICTKSKSKSKSTNS